MRTTTSILDAARQDLALRRDAADRAEHWQERNILAELADVADMVCRIGDHTHSSHYRAEKSGPLVVSAIRVERECLRAYELAAGDPAGAGCDDSIDQAAEVLEYVARAVRRAMWVAARSETPLYASDARDIAGAVAALEWWAQKVCAGAVPDPVEE